MLPSALSAIIRREQKWQRQREAAMILRSAEEEETISLASPANSSTGQITHIKRATGER
jgi:hypothetical protein